MIPSAGEWLRRLWGTFRKAPEDTAMEVGYGVGLAPRLDIPLDAQVAISLAFLSMSQLSICCAAG